jgi:Rab GDP dissociation inhibitor
MVSSTHNVCAKDVYVAIVSSIVETDRPEQEIAPGLQLLGSIHEKYALSLWMGAALTMVSSDL